MTEEQGTTSYEAITFGDPSRLKRWVQRLRLAHACQAAHALGDTSRILDFGAGDGQLSLELRRQGLRAALTSFEPAPSLRAESERKLSGLDVAIAAATPPLPSGGFDAVFCLEVFEHLPPAETERALAEIARLLTPGGRAVFGVPNELHLMALFKGLFRLGRRRGTFDTRLAHIAAAVGGKPPKERERTELDGTLAYYPHHLGFDYRAFQRVLEERFRVERRFGSPLRMLPLAFNSEIYFVAVKR